MDFLSREELLRPSQGGKGTLSSDAYPYFFAFAQLVSYKNEIATTIFNIGDRTKPPRVIVLGNVPAPATASQTASRETLQTQLLCRKTQLTGTALPPCADAAAQYYVDMIEKTTEDGKLRSSITFSVHVDNLVGMLRQTCIAQTDDELDIPAENLLDYLAILICEKIHNRLFQSNPIVCGKGRETLGTRREAAMPALTRKFYTILTQDISYCRWAFEGRFLPPVKPLTRCQNHILRVVVNFLQQHRRDHKLESYPRPDAAWYDATERVTFHHIITRLLDGLARAVEDLLKQKWDCHRRKTDILLDIGSREPDVSSLQRAAVWLSDWTHHLSQLRLGFNKILPHRFKWLERGLRRNDSELFNEETAVEEDTFHHYWLAHGHAQHHQLLITRQCRQLDEIGFPGDNRPPVGSSGIHLPRRIRTRASFSWANE
ncbi:hypothetical protein CSAL01_07394 [Colletotrichum salicis]|uniref:Uncharacterized protein n=1 Tax=Colletotrichum salicis TaxID=1209931 RepID=A0A135S0Q8_9PEZI|nr:hypothetical protein CSAL01_07394 [Colletotrichum salicis]